MLVTGCRPGSATSWSHARSRHGTFSPPAKPCRLPQATNERGCGAGRDRSGRRPCALRRPMRPRMNVSFPPELLKQIADLAARKKLSRSAIVEAAVASFLSPDGADRREAAFARRLDRLSRQVPRLGRKFGLSVERIAPVFRFLPALTPPLPTPAPGTAQLQGPGPDAGF